MTALPRALEATAPRLSDVSGLMVAVSEPAVSWSTTTAIPNWIQDSAELELNCDGRTQIAHLSGCDSVCVPWPFAPLGPRQHFALRVRVRGTDGSASSWSDPAVVTAGFLDTGEWRATFVGAGTARPQLLRAAFEASERVSRATLYTTAFGAYDVEINGVRTDDEELKPGWTSYQWRVNLIASDVTPLIRPGRNAVGMTLAGGWYTEQFGFRDAAAAFYRGAPAAALQLVLDYVDGSQETVVSGPDWRCAPAPQSSASLYQGEVYDACEVIPEWTHPDFDDSAWQPVVIEDSRGATPIPRTAPPVRVIEECVVQQVITTPSGRTVLDFGQNLVGVVRIRVSGPRGHEVTLRHAEVLEDGELGTRPLRNAAATDRYVLHGDGEEVWRPRWTFHGFRYVQVDNWPGEVDTSTSLHLSSTAK